MARYPNNLETIQPETHVLLHSGTPLTTFRSGLIYAKDMNNNSLTIYFDKIYFHSSAFLIKTKPYCGGGLNFRSFFAFLNSHF